MSLPSPLEKLMDAVELNVIQTVDDYAPQHQSTIISRKEEVYKSRKYRPKNTNRKKYPYLSLNGECDSYRDNLDVIAENLLQEYKIKLQESEERKWFDPKFDAVKYETRRNKIKTTSQNIASSTAGIVTFVGAFYLLDSSLDTAFHGAYMIGGMTGLAALWVESLLNPLGKLLTLPYRNSKLLGTRQHKAELKKEYMGKIYRHLKEINPENPILSYRDDWSKLCKN